MSLVGEWLVAVGVWTAVALILTWGRLPGRWRRAVALVTSVAGLAALVAALGAHGQREALTTGQFLLGGAYVTGHVSASASLPYYVVTAVCLLLGTAGLALPDEAAQRLDERWIASAVALSLAITGLRFVLEKVAAPMSWTHAVGITWLAPVLGALFLLRVREEGRGTGALASALLVYGLAARGAVALLTVLATALRLGSHYDLSGVTWVRIAGHVRSFDPGSLNQVLILGVAPQVTFWVAYTVAAGLVGAGFAAVVLWVRRLRVGMVDGGPAAAEPES